MFFKEGAKITLMLAKRNIRYIQEHHVTVVLVTDGSHYCEYSSQSYTHLCVSVGHHYHYGKRREDGIEVAWLDPGYDQWGHGIFSKDTDIQWMTRSQNVNVAEWNACCRKFG
jgi:hypothetical protein